MSNTEEGNLKELSPLRFPSSGPPPLLNPNWRGEFEEEAFFYRIPSVRLSDSVHTCSPLEDFNFEVLYFSLGKVQIKKPLLLYAFPSKRREIETRCAARLRAPVSQPPECLNFFKV